MELLELLIRLVLFFPAWPVTLVWVGVTAGFACMEWCIVKRRPVIITANGIWPMIGTGLWLVMIYVWIAAHPELLPGARVSPVRLALFAVGLALINFTWPCIESCFIHLRDYVRAVQHHKRHGHK
jgi:hypothetical protein